MKREHIKLVNSLSKELEEGNLAIFAGAGFSRGAGYVDWKTLLTPIAEDLDLDIEKEWDLVTLAQYHTNVNQSNRNKLNQLLVTEFSNNLGFTENHKILARLPIYTFWTTNYDKLIESALDSNGRNPDVKYTIKQLATTRKNRDAIVYKMHGDVDHPADAILIRDDYERYHVSMQPFITALSGDLVSKTFLFLGFSFSDPNLEYILSRVRVNYGRDQRQHHCILKRVSQEANEDKADFEYRQKKQNLFEGELLRVGIKTTFIDDYSEITSILKAVEDKHKQKTIFISGAAHDYSPWSQQEAEKFVYNLSRKIAKKDYRVISGFGLGIGSAVITGVLEETIMSGQRLDSEKLVLRPFPQTQSGSRELPELWREYRHTIIDHAGIAIFLFGNKLKDGSVIDSNGMLEEFEIAREKGVFIIPVGMTGYVSKKIWEIVTESFNPADYQNGDSILKLLKDLGDTENKLDEIIDIIFSILNLI